MAYDDSLQIYAGVDSSGVDDGMGDAEERVKDGTGKINEEAENKMNVFSGLFVAAANAAGQAIYGIADKAKDSFVSMLTSGDDYNKAMNQLAASTGATGEELESLKDVAKGVFANNYGESYDDVANAVANVKKQLGDLPADELQTITESAFALSDTFEYDITESTRAAKAMVDNFGISGEYAMELIATGAQNGLDYSGELIDSINEYSVQFAKVGLDADDMFQIFQNGEKSGAWNLDKIGDAVKEFSIRAIDGSESTATGFAAIGLNADEMAWKFAQGGDTAKTAFQQTVTALTSMEDPIARDAAGVALFGTMWEDLGVDAVASLGNIQDGAYATGDAMNAIKEVKYNDVGSAIEGLKRSVGSFTIDARAAFSTGIAGAIGTLVNALNSADGDISVVFDGIVNAVKQAGSAFSGVIGGWVENGKKIIEYLVDGIQKNLPKIQEKAGEIIKFLINGFLNSRKRMIETALPIIQGLIQGITEALPEIMNEGLTILQTLITGITNTLPKLIDQGLLILQNLITGIINALPQILPLAVSIITTLVNGRTQAIVAILEFAPQILTALIDGIIDVLPDLIGCAIQILDALITAIIDNLEPILMACLEILIAIVNGIIDNLDKLIEAAFQIIDKIISELLQEDNIGKLIDTGIDLLGKIIVGLCEFAGRLAEFAGKLFSKLAEELSKIDWSELGKNIFEGIMSGLTGVDFNADEFIGDFGENWIIGFKDFFDIGSPSKLMRDEVGKWLLPGVAVGVEDTSDETADNINESLKSVSEQLETPEIKPPEITEPDVPEQSGINVSAPKPIKFDNPEIEPPEIPEQSEIIVNSPEIEISEPQTKEFDEPEIEMPEFSEKSIIISSPEVRIDAPEKVEFNQSEITIIPVNIPEQPKISLDSPEIEVSEPQPIEFDEPEATFPDNEIFTQQVELLREFSPRNNVPELDDERITAEIQSQLDELMVTLNADNFISRFEAILSGMGNAAVPQYSEVYGQVKTVTEKSENRRSELPQNTQFSPKISVFIGDTEIKDFVISAIDEANAVSGGVSV